MGLHKIQMPDVGEGITEAEIVEWNVKIGDVVRRDIVVAFKLLGVDPDNSATILWKVLSDKKSPKLKKKK